MIEAIGQAAGAGGRAHRRAARIIGVEDGQAIGRQAFEQFLFGGAIRLKRAVKVEMLGTQVGEDADAVVDGADALEVERV